MSDVEIIKYGDMASMVSKGNAKSILATAIGVASQAKALAPVNKKIGVGGQLRNSIGYNAGGTIGGYNQSGGDKSTDKLQTTPKTGEAIVGTALEYAIYQEFGTVKMAAQPFLRPAGLAAGKDAKTAKEVVKAYQEAANKEFKNR